MAMQTTVYARAAVCVEAVQAFVSELARTLQLHPEVRDEADDLEIGLPGSEGTRKILIEWKRDEEPGKEPPGGWDVDDESDGEDTAGRGAERCCPAAYTRTIEALASNPEAAAAFIGSIRAYAGRKHTGTRQVDEQSRKQDGKNGGDIHVNRN
ncbi:MAG: hypothetical protein C0404_05960 [Verrucomicrobia bacterium]|nr:hypothetical protein [Verrucomicrobiota bacterium]